MGAIMLGKSPDESGLVAEINVTPLVDVMLVLLIVFMVTAPLLKPESVGIRLAKTESMQSPSDLSPRSMRLSIDQAGQLFLDDKPISENALRETLKVKKSDPEYLVNLFVDQNLKYARLAEVMAMIRAEGISRMSFVVLTESNGKAR